MVILNQIVGIGDFSIEGNLRLVVIAAIFIGIIVILLCIKFARSGEKTNGKNISKAKTGEDIAESAGGTKEEPVVNSGTIEEKIKNSEAEIITKFAAVIKDVRAKIDTKLAAEAEDMRAEFTTKIEEREKEVVSKIENVIDAKVQEALNKMNDRVDVALRTQKSSTASVLEKLVDSLRTEEAPAGSLTSGKAENAVEEKVGFEKVEEREPEAVDQEAMVSEEIKEEELEVPSEDKADVKLEAEEPIASPGEDEEKVSEESVGDAADFDMQEFLDGEPVGISSSDESNVAVEEDVVSEEITEDELEVPSEGKADIKLEENVSGGAIEDEADFDMQGFLDAEPEEITEDEIEVLSEDKAGVELEAKDQIASSVEIEEKAPESAGGDTADFDIQEFLDELENLPSENDSETEK